MILDRADVNSLNTRFQLDFKRAAECIRIDLVGMIEQRVTAAARNLERFGARNLEKKCSPCSTETEPSKLWVF